MKIKSLATGAILALLGLTMPSILVAQNPPASTFHPGFWQPIARVNLDRPMEIKLINKTDIPLEYDFTTTFDVPPQPIEPESTVVIQESLPIPAYLLINRNSFVNSGEKPSHNLKFNVAVGEDNIVNVEIIKVDTDTPGNTTVNIHETGAIYIY